MTNNKSSMCAALPKWLWWLLTILGLVLLYFLMISSNQEPIESDLKNRVMESMSQENINWASVDLVGRGRDVLLTGAAPSADARDRAIEITENVHGVRIVEYQIEVDTVASSKPASSKVVPPKLASPKIKPIAKAPAAAVVAAEDAVLNVCQSKLDNEMKNKQVLFATNAAEVKSGSYPLLDEVVDVLKECRETVAMRGLTIGGHTDSMGNDTYNMTLSQKRADAVKSYIVRSGVDASILKSVGYGESYPVGSNATAEGRAQNRRIVFTIERN